PFGPPLSGEQILPKIPANHDHHNLQGTEDTEKFLGRMVHMPLHSALVAAVKLSALSDSVVGHLNREGDDFSLVRFRVPRTLLATIAPAK
ncbi:MAG: hypothetical protein KDA88_19290, partial [Planctomycetaceae bacterium]|nr:hypothetical protein [Planctomycetaceae bacterium]